MRTDMKNSCDPKGNLQHRHYHKAVCCDKSGSARRTTLGYNGWEHTTSTTSRVMIGGSFIKENMVRPKDSEDEDMFGAE
ncbi:hypothetical protein YC2023_016699 [Brassica napus]